MMPPSNKIRRAVSCLKKRMKGSGGIAIGIVIGAGIGAITGDLAIWTAIGTAVGCSFGSCARKKC